MKKFLSVACMVALAAGCCRTAECKKTVEGKKGDAPAASTADTGVKASSFGWKADDATAALQAAIDSGAAKIVVDRQAGDWIVTPIVLRRSNQEVVVADGVTIRAKKGVFKKITECLFTIPAGVSNVVLRGEGSATLAMNKKDYQNHDNYDFSEWRHAVSITGARNVTVRDLTVLSSGGDGVYVRNASRNVRLDRLVCRDHHRQGISVISAVDMLVTNCRFEETSGTPPQCGVDIEPNVPKDRLENVVFEDCVFSDNASSGIMLHLAPLDDTTRPISVKFRRCVSRGNRHCGIRVNCAGPSGRAVRGKLDFEDCTAEGNKGSALVLASKRSDSLDISFRNCTLDARGSASEAIQFNNGAFLANFGGVSFENVRVRAGDGKPIAFDGAAGTGITPNTMHGEISAEKADGKVEKISLDGFAKSHPTNPEMLRALLSFKTVPPDYRAIKAVPGAKPLSKPASTGWLRGKFTFVQYIPAAGDYPIVFRTRPLGTRAGFMKVQVMDAAGTDLGIFKVKDPVMTNVIHATGSGIRRFEASILSGLASVESVWPGQGLQADSYVHPFGGRNRKFWFTVPASAADVFIQVRPEEPCSARLLRPDGSVASEMPYGTGLTLLKAKRSPSASAETWCLDFPRIGEDATFRIGSPALPFAAPHKDMPLR